MVFLKEYLENVNFVYKNKQTNTNHKKKKKREKQQQKPTTKKNPQQQQQHQQQHMTKETKFVLNFPSMQS